MDLSTGLIAILDDVAALAKAAAVSLDDIATQTAKAGSKAAGIVIDDAAVTPRYVVGLAADRELPIIKSIASGSLENKILFLLPGALLLSTFAPVVITPLLMIGGFYLVYEGLHKAVGMFRPGHGGETTGMAGSEAERIASAIRTDFILSAEIMAITLASVSGAEIWKQAAVLGVTGLAMTVLVYGTVALIVKADDAGLALAQASNPGVRSLGRAIVRGMPLFLQALSVIGMIAMIWVGAGIILHGYHELTGSNP